MNLLSEALRHIIKSIPRDVRWMSRIRLLTEIADKVEDLEAPMDEDVAAFHRRFGHPAPAVPCIASDHTLDFRIKLIREEADELCEAIEARDLGRIAQEAMDLLYVTFGTLVVCGLRAGPFWRMVHKANMAKIPNPDGGKPLKPEGWVKPDCGLLIDMGRAVREADE